MPDDTLTPAAAALRAEFLRLAAAADLWQEAAPRAVLIEPDPKETDENTGDAETMATRGASALMTALEPEIILYRDADHGTPYAAMDGRLQTIDPKNKPFTDALALRNVEITGKLIGSTSIGGFLSYLAGRARRDGIPCRLSNRTATDGSSYFFDMGEGRPAVKVSPGAWERIPEPLAMFRRFAHQMAPPDPIGGGNPWLLFETANIRPEQQLLALIVLVTDFIHGINHPMKVYRGSNGSAKTTTAGQIRMVLDPSVVPYVNIPRKEEDIPILFHKYKAPIIDNVSTISASIADMFCVAIMGGAIEKRTLHTDLETTVIRENPVLSITTIANPHDRPDLAERSITFNLERPDPARRMSEKKAWAMFYRNLPSILGGVFDLLAAAMEIHKTINLHELPRMADFATWGFAVAEALGGRGAEFLRDYTAAGHRQTLESLETNTFAGAIVRLVDSEGERLSGTFTEVLEKLRSEANPEPKDQTFPASARGFRSHLERIRPNLEELGLIVDLTAPGEGRTARGKGFVEIYKREANPSAPAELAGLVFDAGELDP